MARLLHHLVEPPHECPYLKDRQAQLEIRVQVEVTPEELESMLERGWRRFGPVYFRPACASCGECVTLRIDVDEFTPTKSMRRAAKNAAHLKRILGTPENDLERIALYRRWHAHRERVRGWDESPIDEQRYGFDFAFPHPSVREVAFRNGERLVGLGICDETPNALSAVYFFWDPEHAPPSLGTAHVLALIEQARATGKPHVYLGYRVEGCPSLVYKSRYRPHELLEGRPGPTEAPRWKKA